MRAIPAADQHLVTTIGDLVRRMQRLETWAAAQSHADIDFSQPGAISTGTWPPKAFPAVAGLVIGMWVLLGTAGTTTSTFQLRKNGSAVSGSSVSLASGATSGSADLTVGGTVPGVGFLGPYSDLLVPECTAAGTGAADVTIMVKWRPAT